MKLLPIHLIIQQMLSTDRGLALPRDASGFGEVCDTCGGAASPRNARVLVAFLGTARECPRGGTRGYPPLGDQTLSAGIAGGMALRAKEGGSWMCLRKRRKAPVAGAR